jgi:hypothetical protein
MEESSQIKKIICYIPSNESLPDGFSQCSPEEVSLIIKTGYSALTIAKNELQEIGHEEVIQSVRRELCKNHEIVYEELKDKITNLQREIDVKTELHKTVFNNYEEKMESQLASRLSVQQTIFDRIQQANNYEREQLQTEIIRLRDAQKSDIAEKAMNMVHTDLENMRAILTEKDKQNEQMKGLFERAVEKIDTISQKKSVVSIGKIGETQFKSIAESTFRDFEGFELEDVHSVGGQGDFHLKFREFTVLADSKLYSHKVNSTSRDKIKRDLKKNEHIHFAWLVSLDTMIDKFDKAPFMFEWLSEKKCVCYVNHLLRYEEPGEILRAVYYCCKVLYGIINGYGEENLNEINKLKERELKIREIAQKMIKNSRERETLMTQFRANFDKNDEYIREILDGETNKMAGECFGEVVKWWNENITQDAGEKIKSTVLWNQYKKYLESTNAENNMDANDFKNILCSFLHESKIVRPKTKGGALEIIGYKIK